MSTPTTTLLGVRIWAGTCLEAQKQSRVFLTGDAQHMIFTPNPEMLVLAHRDKEFRDILNSSSLNLCDGKGIQLFAKNKPERIPGVEFIYELCAIAVEEGKSVYLLGSGAQKTVEKARAELKRQFPKLTIVGAASGPRLDDQGVGDDEKAVDDIIAAAPDILLVGFGHGKQERWIAKHLTEFPSVKIAMGVGGSFDFISGKVKRAPEIVQKLGFEWLWRLVLQPWRLKRIWTAVIVFLFLCLRSN